MATRHTDISSVVTWTKPEKELPPFGQDVVTIWSVIGSASEVAILPAHRISGKQFVKDCNGFANQNPGEFERVLLWTPIPIIELRESNPAK